jgi:hypothetical protein
MGGGGKGVREGNRRGCRDRSKAHPQWDALRHPFEHQLRQDCEIVQGVCVGRYLWEGKGQRRSLK